MIHCSLSLMVCLACALAVTGCIVPVPLKVATTTPAGQKLVVPSAPPVPGKTTRKDVEDQYRDFAVESGVPNLFWGQFQESTGGVYWLIAGYGGAEGGGGRVWNKYNILATFDESGTVKSFAQVQDSGIIAQLTQMQKEGIFPPLDVSSPVELEGLQLLVDMNGNVSQAMIRIELSPTEMKVVIQRNPLVTAKKPPKPKPPVTAMVPIAQVAGLHVGPRPQHWDPSFKTRPYALTVGFTEKTAIGSSLKMQAEPRAAPTLVRWLGQGKPAAK